MLKPQNISFVFQTTQADWSLTSSSSSSSISSSGGRVDTGPADGESSSIAAISVSVRGSETDDRDEAGVTIYFSKMLNAPPGGAAVS